MRGAHLTVAIALLGMIGCANINDDTPPPPVDHGLPEEVPFDGAAWRASEAPPAVTGGHLALLPDRRAAVADPDSRELLIVDEVGWATMFISARYPLGAEPGRVIADGAGGVHVVLRDAGAIASLELGTGAMAMRSVCALPRGLGYDAETDALFVACLDGRLQRLPRTGGAAETIAQLEGGDLRDVVPQPEGLWVTRFRSARVSLLDRDGAPLGPEVVLPALDASRESLHASVAWRAVARPGGGIAISHQRHTDRVVSTVVPEEDPFVEGGGGAYGGGFDPSTGECRPPLIVSALTELDAQGAVVSTKIVPGSLPVDLGSDLGGTAVALAAVGGSLESDIQLAADIPPVDPAFCVSADRLSFPRTSVTGQVVSVAMLDGTTVFQTRFPSQLAVWGLEGGSSILLGAEDRRDAGHALFHGATSSGLACASCHPEGGEDGVRWSFFGVGARRTQELRGGLLATAPFHWNGDVPSVEHIMNDVFSGRMGGGTPTAEQRQLVGSWLDALPLPVPEASERAAHGRELFEREGCGDCHGGAALTNNASADFGRGALQVPPLLGVSMRGPWMHDGCASSLEATVVASCAGEGHGVSLPDDELGDLVAYLRTL